MELMEIISVVKMSKNSLGIRFVVAFGRVWVVRYGCAVALVECEIEVLSGSFAPWMLEKMKIHPYTKNARKSAKRRVYNALYFLCAFVLSLQLYGLGRRPCRLLAILSYIFCIIVQYSITCL